MSESSDHIGGIVLCGGHSRRMGRCKAWLPWGDEPLLTHVVRIVADSVSPVVVAARAGQRLPDLPPAVVRVDDAVADAGPLAGIAAGFAALPRRCAAAVVISCDHPFITREWIAVLIDLLGDDPGVVPSDGERLYPCTAIYRGAAGRVADRMIASGEHRAQRFARACGARIVSTERWRSVDPNGVALRNLNDPDVYDRLRPSAPLE